MALAVLSAAAAAAFVTAAACGSSGGDEAVYDELNLDPIVALAGAASTDADAMDQHADAMTSAAADRADHAHWAADAETIRANARSLRVLAGSAKAIEHDPGARPGNAIELGRVYGDGTNLHALGQTLVDHADAMQAHISVMRDEAAGDPELLQAVDAFAPNVGAMKADGEAAMDYGIALMNEARRLAQSIGEELPPGGEHDGN